MSSNECSSARQLFQYNAFGFVTVFYVVFGEGSQGHIPHTLVAMSALKMVRILMLESISLPR